MATWKEKGVVPDSDDDEELDFQFSTNEGHAREVQVLQHCDGARHDRSLNDGKQELPDDPTQKASQISCGLGLSVPRLQQTQRFPSDSPRVFKVPLTLSDIDHETGPEPMDLCENSNVGEDISRSYVTLSSQSSSLTSLTSLVNDDWETDGIHEDGNETQNLLIQYASEEIGNDRDQEMQDSAFDFPSTNRRSLRQRNPIQLHPYALEGEKYRQTLMARGMKPVRLTQVQQTARKDNYEKYSPEPDTEQENESQNLSFGDRLQSSQTSSEVSTVGGAANAPPSSNTHDSVNALEEEEEDLPDLDELLSRKAVDLRRRGVKRQRVTYASRHTSGLPSSTVARSVQSRNLLNASASVGDIPASPPATSSPIPPQGLFISKIKIPKLSEMPSDRAFSLERTDSDEIARTGNLPTPATENIKHTIDLTVDNIYEQGDFASDSDSQSSSSNADQFLHLRRAGKRIRGVLPASWLRLDQQTKGVEESKAARREARSLSPLKVPIRRGIAIRRDVTAENSPSMKPKHAVGERVQFDESDDDDEEYELAGFIRESTPDTSQDFFPSRGEADYAIEDDRIDIMVPQMRQSKLLPGFKKRKRSHASTSLFHPKRNGGEYQPKITEHLSRPRKSYSSNNKPRNQRVPSNGPSSRKVRSKTTKPHFANKILPPKLSILDVVSSSADSRERLPQFIRIAARNARSRKNLGRQSPTRKFIRLANRNDTLDAQSVLREWREGTIQPREKAVSIQLAHQIRTPLGDRTEETLNGVLPWPLNSATADIAEISARPRKLAISKPRQLKLGEMIESGSSKSVQGIPPKLKPGPLRQRQVFRPATATVRPAQLETTLSEYSHNHPSHAFVSTKKALDNLYKKAHRGSVLKGDDQLARFLTRDPLSKTKHAAPSTDPSKNEEDVPALPGAPHKQPRRKKQTPHRVDAGAAMFRQPSEPLVLEFLQEDPESQDMTRNNGKLIGLGSYGTTYTYHFDIFPIPHGVFFHESTFIGSGKLCRALELPSNRHFDVDRGHAFHQLAGKQLRWGPWNDVVSSELGLCFDWIAEQLEVHAEKRLETNPSVMLECLTFVIGFVQNYLSFPNQSDRAECLLRFLEVLDAMIVRLESLSITSVANDTRDLKPLVELSSQGMVLIFQLLRIAQLDTFELDLTRRFEASLQRAASLSIRQLLRIGLAPVRGLYDNLQYLAVREAGIKPDEYIVQAWLVAMHVLRTVQIPRVSFWDVFNMELMKDCECQLNDARVLERMWYSMFSLLPLVEFDKTGVIVCGSRMSKSFENWALPQRMAKKVFELYATKSRQSPSFNDYCRALFNRCSHLIQSWGWQRHISVVGTLFDFFATHKLAHLRNEEVYQSPRFLEELDREPELSIELEDRCFHILLKIIAISVKQMRVVGDARGIRNLVTRVLPNHDRQYPKDEAIHQRDLASLRNHHDLLCTLFWAAPPELRPPLSLLRELVNPERSHKEAYLISLRAWENLTRFVLASDPTLEAYLPLGIWQYESFAQLLIQHRSAEKDIEEQLSKLSHSEKQLIPQEAIARTVRGNRNQTIMALIKHLQALEATLRRARTLKAMAILFKQPLFTYTILETLHLFRQGQKEDMRVVAKALDILIFYVYEVKTAALSRFPADNQTSQEDSQGLDASSLEKMEFRAEYFGQLDGSLLAAVRDVLRFCVRSVSPVNNIYVEKVVRAWGLMAGTTILCERFSLADFISDSGIYAELKMDDPSSTVRSYTGQFLSALVTVTDSRVDFAASERDILSDWLCLLVTPVQFVRLEDMETLGREFAACEPMLKCIRNKIKFRPTHILVQVHELSINMIKTVFHQMYESLHGKPGDVSNRDNLKSRYQAILERIMMTLKMDLSDMAPDTCWAKFHWKLVERVIDNITAFFGDFCPIDDFFKTSSACPAEDSSKMVVATFRQYGLRLDADRGRSELNHYCFSIFKKAAVEGNLDNLFEQLRESMTVEEGPWRALTKHILTVFIPSVTYAAFLSDFGWLPADLFLQVAEHQLSDVADLDPELALDAAGAIVRLIINGLKILLAKCPRNDKELKHETIYILLIVTRFMTSIIEWLAFLLDQVKEEDVATAHDLRHDFACFQNFAHFAGIYLREPIRTWFNGLPGTQLLFQQRRKRVEDRIKDYEALDPNDEALLDKKAVALRNLWESLPPHMQVIRTWSTVWSLQRRKYIWGSLIFRGIHESPFARPHPNSVVDIGAGFLPESLPLADGPEFSAVILEDIRNYWRYGINGFDIKIRTGSLEKVARDTEGLLSDSPALYKALEKELGGFTWSYNRAFKSTDVWVSRQRHDAGKDLPVV